MFKRGERVIVDFDHPSLLGLWGYEHKFLKERLFKLFAYYIYTSVDDYLSINFVDKNNTLNLEIKYNFYYAIPKPAVSKYKPPLVEDFI